MMNGYVLGPLLIVFGACISYYTGMLIVKCAEHTGRTRYEDIAEALYGKRWSRVTSYLNLICLIGFTFSYIVYVKTAIPQIIEIYACPDKQGDEKCGDVSDWIADTPKGETFWGVLFSFCIAFPMSIPRNASSLRFSSLFGVLCSMYLCIAVTCTFFLNTNVVPDPRSNL